MRRRRTNEEAEIQKRLVAKLKTRFYALGFQDGTFPFFHCPNESQAPPQYRSHLNKMGLSKGVPDLVFLFPTITGFRGAALELKIERGRPTKEQNKWLNFFSIAGFATALAKGEAAAEEQLRRWGYLM